MGCHTNMQQSLTRPNRQAGITVSVVSHGHGAMVEQLVAQLLQETSLTRLIVTLNRPETLALPSDDRIVCIRNQVPKGFGANHNAAFEQSNTTHFAVLNPDLRLIEPLLENLLNCLEVARAAVVAPVVISPEGRVEDSWRRSPTLLGLAQKALGHDQSIMKPPSDAQIFYPDWVAGMCMLFDAQAFEQIGGFDERFFLYYEDVDICTRLWQANLEVAGCCHCRVIHAAQRESHGNLRYLRWHLGSMLRYLLKYTGRQPRSASEKRAAVS